MVLHGKLCGRVGRCIFIIKPASLSLAGFFYAPKTSLLHCVKLLFYPPEMRNFWGVLFLGLVLSTPSQACESIFEQVKEGLLRARTLLERSEKARLPVIDGRPLHLILQDGPPKIYVTYPEGGQQYGVIDMADGFGFQSPDYEYVERPLALGEGLNLRSLDVATVLPQFLLATFTLASDPGSLILVPAYANPKSGRLQVLDQSHLMYEVQGVQDSTNNFVVTHQPGSGVVFIVDGSMRIRRVGVAAKTDEALMEAIEAGKISALSLNPENVELEMEAYEDEVLRLPEDLGYEVQGIEKLQFFSDAQSGFVRLSEPSGEKRIAYFQLDPETGELVVFWREAVVVSGQVRSAAHPQYPYVFDVNGRGLDVFYLDEAEAEFRLGHHLELDSFLKAGEKPLGVEFFAEKVGLETAVRAILMIGREDSSETRLVFIDLGSKSL